MSDSRWVRVWVSVSVPSRGRCVAPQDYVSQHCVSAVEAVELTRTYGRSYALRKASFTLESGTVTAIIGGNGAGKTTLFYTIMGLIKRDAGSILLDKNEISELPMYRRSKMGLGYLPQESSIFRGMNSKY